MSVKLEELLTDEEIRRAYTEAPGLFGGIRACIRLAVEKAEKVEGFATADKFPPSGGYYFAPDAKWFAAQGEPQRHALILLGPRFEPKPVKTAEERIAEALKISGVDHVHQRVACTKACEMARILRGEE